MDRRQFLGGSIRSWSCTVLTGRYLRQANLPADLTELSASQLSAVIREQHVDLRRSHEGLSRQNSSI